MYLLIIFWSGFGKEALLLFKADSPSGVYKTADRLPTLQLPGKSVKTNHL